MPHLASLPLVLLPTLAGLCVGPAAAEPAPPEPARFIPRSTDPHRPSTPDSQVDSGDFSVFFTTFFAGR